MYIALEENSGIKILSFKLHQAFKDSPTPAARPPDTESHCCIVFLC